MRVHVCVCIYVCIYIATVQEQPKPSAPPQNIANDKSITNPSEPTQCQPCVPSTDCTQRSTQTRYVPTSADAVSC